MPALLQVRHCRPPQWHAGPLISWVHILLLVNARAC